MTPRLLILALLVLTACPGQRSAETEVVDRQQATYLAVQPIPTYDRSLERGRTIELYNARMRATQTWSVWRSQTGQVEGDCPSSGYPIPYGVQLTSPSVYGYNGAVLPQAEPNGLFTDGVTSEATWVFCVLDGQISPVYVETKVTAYPYPIEVDYETGMIKRVGDPTLTIKD